MPIRSRSRAVGALITLSALACGRPSVPAGSPGAGALRARATADADPTVRGARVVPESVQEERSLGSEPGGGVRAIAAGVRVVSMPNGAVLASEERLPQPPQITLPVPERLGGGFLFVLGSGSVGSTVWRADRWLAEAHPIFQATSSIHHVVFGLDRVYLRAQNGAHTAIDGRTGARLDLGPWPGSSYVGAYVAADGWRAVAVNDLRGAVATFDAGATWRALSLPVDVKNVMLHGDAIAVGGLDPAREQVWYEVRPDGQVGRLGPMPTAPAGSRDEKDKVDPAASQPRPLGKRPLVAAIEDGWPLVDGTAIVARDGALARVRLSDGALVDHVPDVFPLKPSRCHPIALPKDGAPGAFGFVCGEVRGPTVVYAFEPAQGALREMARFERPRAVLGFANGALAVRGSCDPGADEPATAAPPPQEKSDEKERPRLFCILPRSGPAYALPVTGMLEGDRLVVLADGRVAVLSVPHGDLGAARITLRNGTAQTTLPLAFHAKGADPAAPIGADVQRALRLGVWLDGWEERRPGVIGGWIDAGGAVLGVEIAADGNATHGPFLRDAGAPMVSGRYGLGWTASRRGVETIDGGLTWTPIEVPDPLVPARTIPARACGPIGCTAAGWIRVGWGAPRRPPPPEVPAPPRSLPVRSTDPLSLVCEPVAPTPPPPPEPKAPPKAPEPVTRPRVMNPWGGSVISVLGNSGTMDLLPFYTSGPPALHPDERALTAEAAERLEHAPRTGPLARVYAWGPKTGEWEHASRWIARWVSPFGGWQEVRSSLPAPPPQLLLDAARFASPSSMPILATWQLGVSDDGAHALLVARRSSGREVSVFEVEDGRAPVELRRADGEPLGELEAAVRTGGRWYLASAPVNDWFSTIWQVDGPVVRELARVPRAGMDTRPTGARLARRSDGRAIGLVVDGQPIPDRSGAQRWVLPIDLETGSLGDPESLHAADLGDRGTVALCTDDDAGWVLDTPWNLGVGLYAGAKRTGSLTTIDARVRVTSSSACVERLAGTMGALGGEQLAALVRSGPARPAAPGAIPVVVVSASSRSSQMRYPLRCTRK